jgi:hypothetical protein
MNTAVIGYMFLTRQYNSCIRRAAMVWNHNFYMCVTYIFEVLRYKPERVHVAGLYKSETQAVPPQM